MGAEINSVLENAAAEAGEPDAKHEGRKDSAAKGYSSRGRIIGQRCLR